MSVSVNIYQSSARSIFVFIFLVDLSLLWCWRIWVQSDYLQMTSPKLWFCSIQFIMLYLEPDSLDLMIITVTKMYSKLAETKKTQCHKLLTNPLNVFGESLGERNSIGQTNRVKSCKPFWYPMCFPISNPPFPHGFYPEASGPSGRHSFSDESHAGRNNGWHDRRWGENHLQMKGTMERSWSCNEDK